MRGRAPLAAVVTAAVSSVIVASLVGPPASAAPRPGVPTAGSLAPSAADALQRAAGGSAQLDRRGNAAHAVSAPGRTLGRPAGVPSGAPAATVARAYLAQHGAVFGVRDQARELRVERTLPRNGRSAVRMRQLVGGVPVIGGELVVETRTGGEVASVHGETTQSRPSTLRPAITARHAAKIAVRVGSRKGAAVARGTASPPSLEVYDPALLGGPGGRTRLVWRTEVRRADERLLVLVDATTGAIALQFDMHAEARNRSVCDANSTASMTCTEANTKRVEGGPAVPNDADVNNAYDYSGATYDYFFERFGRDGIDNAGMLMESVVRLCPQGQKCPWDNAAWTGSQMVYGAGLASADDVVAHELAHGVTEHESNLYYWFQSGAINESLSDVFGELIDQAYLGNSTDTSATRWKLGEDLPSDIGVIRDMKNPNLFDQPDDMADAKYFAGIHPTQGYVVDNGGVHYNSGVNNKAAQLLVDGGSHNGVTVASIGATKTARLYYDVHDRLTSAADYNDLYWALKATCSALATAGTDGFTGTDCTAVNNALAAVKMSQEPPVAKTAPAGTCNTGASLVQTVLTENFDAPLTSAWTRGYTVGGNKWFGPAASSYGGPYATSGTGAIRGYNDDVRSDSWMGRTAALTVPAAGANTPYLRFNSAWSFERSSGTNFDGGIIEVSANGGAWTDVATLGLPVSRGYNGTITTAAGFDNPLRGRKAFVGTSNGYTATRVDLTKVAGKSLRFRFRVGTDSDVADEGWFIDDLKVYTCTYGPTGVAIAVSPARSFYGSSASFHGRLLKAGTTTGVGGQRLVLQYRVPGATTWTSKAYATTASTGTVGMATYTFKPTRNYEYRYLFPSSNGWRGSASVTRTHVVVPVVTSKLSPTSMRLGSTALLSGTVTPSHAGKTVYLQRFVNGAWGTLSSRALSSTSTYAFGIKPTARGTYSYRVLFTGDADHGAAASTTRVLTVS